jgi:hypothetical protein
LHGLRGREPRQGNGGNVGVLASLRTHALHTDNLLASGASAEALARPHHLLELKGIGLLIGEVMDIYKPMVWELGLRAEHNRVAASCAITSQGPPQ